MPSATIQRLRAVNHNLRAWLARFPSERNGPVAVALTEVTDLLAELRRASACLHTAAGIPDVEMASEISEYRSHVQALEKILPSVQGRLLIEKARLQIARAHMAKAAAWAQGSQKTL